MTDLQIAQKKLTNILNSFHNICCKYNLKYWCLGGTLVGAVRNNGFIPWDGDVDVAMLSSDYEIFEKHVQDELPSTMYFFGKCGFKGLAKIRDLYSSYMNSSDKNDNNHHGLQLDIFIYNVKEIDCIKYVVSIESWLSKYKEDSFKYDTIFPVNTINFEDIIVYIPNKVDEICEYSYGGYPPPLPPIEKQICHEGRIDPINPALYFPIVFKDIYQRKTQQWFTETVNKNGVPLHHMSGWNYINQEEWDNLCTTFLQGVDIHKIKRLFDAGCGVGSLFNYVANINPQVKLYGCDINRMAVNKCRLLFPQAKVKLHDITDLNKYKADLFDVVLCVSTMSYLYSLDDVKIAVDQLLRITKKNGKIHICIMSDNINGLKSFNILIPKSFWRKEEINVSNIEIIDIPFSKFSNRYSVFITK
jgi:phosphorylcholine metabolism protein LicD